MAYVCTRGGGGAGGSRTRPGAGPACRRSPRTTTPQRGPTPRRRATSSASAWRTSTRSSARSAVASSARSTTSTSTPAARRARGALRAASRYFLVGSEHRPDSKNRACKSKEGAHQRAEPSDGDRGTVRVTATTTTAILRLPNPGCSRASARRFCFGELAAVSAEDADAADAARWSRDPTPQLPRVRRRARAARGGAVVLVRDISASMWGARAQWASSVVLRLVDEVARRARMRVGCVCLAAVGMPSVVVMRSVVVVATSRRRRCHVVSWRRAVSSVVVATSRRGVALFLGSRTPTRFRAHAYVTALW